MSHFKDMKKIHEDKEKAVFRNKSGHEIRVAKKTLSSSMLKKLSNLPLHSAEGNYVSEPEEFEPGRDYSVAPLPGDPIASFAPQKTEPEIDAYAEQLQKPMAGAFEKPLAPVEQDRILAEEAEPVTQPAAPAQAPKAVSKPAEPPKIQAPAAKPVNTQEQHFQTLSQETQNFAADLTNGVIKPQTMQDLYGKKDTLGKIGTLFGLMLSGIGSGLAGQPNAVLEMMKSEIQNDLDAQKESAKNKQNLFRLNFENQLTKANIELAGANTELARKNAEIAATELTKNQLMLGVLNNALGQINKLPNGSPQKQAGLQTLSTMSQAVDQEIQLGNTRASQQMTDEEAMFNKRQQSLMAAAAAGVPGMAEMARFEAERHVPGVGNASIPVPANVREEMVAHQRLENAATDLLEYSKSHTNLVPGTPEYNTGAQKALVLQQMVREGLLGTVFRESEKPLLEKFVNENPAGALKAISTQPKLRALIESNALASNTTKKAYGLPTKAGGKKSSSEKLGPDEKIVNGYVVNHKLKKVIRKAK